MRPWLAPATVCLALLVFLVTPWIEKNRDIRFLTNAGFTWNEAKSEIAVGTGAGREITSLDSLSAALHRMKPRRLDLSYCQSLTNLNGLKGLTALQYLGLKNCYRLQNVDDLKNLTALQYLDLEGCGSLINGDVFKGLTALINLNLDSCIHISICCLR